ncbi:MAG TPA: LbtU family siderophore porin [Desulfobacterales bacterium]
MKVRKEQRIGRWLFVLTAAVFVTAIFASAGPAVAAEPDEQKLLNQLKAELAEEDTLMGKILDRFEFGLLIEAGAVYRDENEAGEAESDFALTTVEFGIAAVINEWVTGEVVLLFEDPTFDDEDSDFNVDVGSITVGNTTRYPLYATIGMIYVPYGALLTHFPDDPLIDSPVTLTFGEINEKALLVGFETGGFGLAAYAFNGDVEEDGDDENQIDSYGLDANYTYEREADALMLMVGASYLSNLADTDGISDALPSDKLQDTVAGWAAYFSSGWGRFFFEAEYMAALDDFDTAELATDGGAGAEPAVWNIEAGFNYDWWRNLEVAFKYAGSDEAEGLGIPGTRFGVALNQEIFDNTVLSMGYLNDEFDANLLDNGNEDKRQTLFSQIAIEF